MTTEIRIKHITRIDSGNTHGWYVRIRKRGKRFERLFSDLKHGSKDWAFFQAVLYLDECIERIEVHKSAVESARIRRAKKFSRGYEYDVYEVSWIQSARARKKKAFSIKKYGEDKALKKAESWAKAVNRAS